MKLLVTGAAGMLGSALCPTLRAAGHEVTRDRHPPHRPGMDRLDVRDGARWRRAAATSNPTGSCTWPPRPAWRCVRPTSTRLSDQHRRDTERGLDVP